MPRALPLALLLCACDPLAGLTVVGEDPSEAPLRGLDEAWTQRFEEGDAAFEAPLRASQGLGPLYIRHACVSCHEADARGPGTVRRMVLVDADGAPLADQTALAYGHVIRPQLAAGATTPIEPPPEAQVWIATRLPPAVFGRGYLEAIRDDAIERHAADQAARADGVSGRVHRVPWQSEDHPSPRGFHDHGRGDVGLIGRFGLRARIATLDEFAADAYQGDMGITTPLRPDELTNPDALDDDDAPGIDLPLETVDAVADYVRLLAIPPREPAPEGAAALFEATGCATCHVPTSPTRDDYPIEPLAGIDAPVYTDLLLHDMGAALAGAVGDLDATASEWRTAPLIGLRHQRAYLHDGRAATVEAALEAHGAEGSEAAGAAERFASLSPADRALLLTFVESL